MNTRTLFLAVIAGISLAGCSEDAVMEETKNVDWYKANKQERLAKIGE